LPFFAESKFRNMRRSEAAHRAVRQGSPPALRSNDQVAAALICVALTLALFFLATKIALSW
jgi:hypothetical protein